MNNIYHFIHFLQAAAQREVSTLSCTLTAHHPPELLIIVLIAR